MTAVRLAFCAMSVASCFAQAWLPPKGEGSISVGYQGLFFDGHYLTDGTKAAAYQSRANNIVTDITYGVTDRIAVSLQMPVIFTKYTGNNPPFNPSTVDDHRYHGTFQDLRFEVMGKLLQKPLTVTPFFAFVIPSHDYEVVGEAAPGRGVKEYWAGVSVGRLLTPFSSRAYVHARYDYAFVERILDIPLNRSDLDLEFGYFVTPSLSVRALGSLLRTHGGLTLDEVFGGPVDPKIYLNHDRFLDANYQHVGGGLSFAVNPAMDLHFNIVKFLSGRNAHYGKAFTAGVTWTFNTRRETTRKSSNAFMSGRRPRG